MNEKKGFIYSDAEGEFLVKLARKSLTFYLKNGKYIEVPHDTPENLKKNAGVFVTLRIYGKSPQTSLRGCIGRPYPQLPLVQATIEAAVDSGINDWRFNRVILEELDNIIFEVTALTPPVKIEASTPEERLNAIEIGRDGLIIRRKGAPPGHGGLFLPQVPVEWHWDKKEYLEELCGKAGLPSYMWKDVNKTELFKFQGEIFAEKKPNGEIERIIL
ncbi:MAG: TIGR00296 family protein [Promethearchaeota archaeon]